MSRMYDLRPLKTVELLPPDYRVNAHLLLDSCVEKEIKFAGIIPDVPHALDPTNRTEVLRVMDQGKRDKFLSRTLQDAIFYLNARYIKLLTRDKTENLLLRLPIHHVAAMSYICEDEHHIIGIKYGEFDLKAQHIGSPDDSPTCNLVVLYCDCRGRSSHDYRKMMKAMERRRTVPVAIASPSSSFFYNHGFMAGGKSLDLSETKRTAEELCALVDQCFQAVYTDATMHYFDRSLRESAHTPGTTGIASVDYSFTDKSASSTPNVVSRVPHEPPPPATLGFLSHSSLDLGTLSSATSRSLSRATARGSDVELSAAANQLILDYMKKLYDKLNPDELQRFALLVKAWHTDLSFPDFCDGVLELYGASRKYLLVGMQPFIPAKDLTYFEQFIERIGLSNSQMDSAPPARGYRAPISSVAWYQPSSSTSDSIDGFDMLNELTNGNNTDRFGSNQP